MTEGIVQHNSPTPETEQKQPASIIDNNGENTSAQQPDKATTESNNNSNNRNNDNNKDVSDTNPLFIPGEGKIEADTAADEGDINLEELLLPGGKLPLNVSNFSLSYNQAAFQGWVKQVSPVCAASSVAGAWNTVMNCGRDGEKSAGQDTVLEIYTDILGEQLKKADESLRRVLLVPSLQEIDTVISEKLKETDRHICGRKTRGTNPKECISILKKFCAELVLKTASLQPSPTDTPMVDTADIKNDNNDAVDDDNHDNQTIGGIPMYSLVPNENGLPGNCIASLVDVWKITPETAIELTKSGSNNDDTSSLNKPTEAVDSTTTTTTTITPTTTTNDQNKQKKIADNNADETNEEEEQEEYQLDSDDQIDEENDAEEKQKVNGGNTDENSAKTTTTTTTTTTPTDSTASKQPKKKKNTKKPTAKPAKSLSQLTFLALSKWFRVKIALAKLTRTPAPSTAGIGNWGITQATQILSEKHNIDVKSRALLGRGTTVLHKTKVCDCAKVVTKQWNALTEAFTAKNSSILFHLTNHYALLYALRSWTDSEGVTHREVLTARKGQRPNVWISFTECRSIVNGWIGYKMYQIYLSPPKVKKEKSRSRSSSEESNKTNSDKHEMNNDNNNNDV